jgi:predicted nucleic acid-binding protein
MAFLLDTCVVSEPLQKSPKAEVLQFLGTLVPSESYISVITIGEIWKGIQILPASRKRNQLLDWFREDFRPGFSGRIVQLDQPCLVTWGELWARLESSGLPMPSVDSFLAATALHYDLTIVTRNEDDFVNSGCRILNPWK